MLLQYKRTLFFTPVGVKSESRSKSRSYKDDLGKVSREKNINFSYTVLVSVKSESGSESKSNKN